MLLSGGTTSLSKLIPRTHDDYVLNARLCGGGRRLRGCHGVHGHPAARAQLQPRLAGHARRLVPRRDCVVLAPSGDAADVFSLVAQARR
jgi:2,3-dihydroxybenzoate-AMP ligase